jgi:hypothetical protein
MPRGRSWVKLLAQPLQSAVEHERAIRLAMATSNSRRHFPYRATFPAVRRSHDIFLIRSSGCLRNKCRPDSKVCIQSDAGILVLCYPDPGRPNCALSHDAARWDDDDRQGTHSRRQVELQTSAAAHPPKCRPRSGECEPPPRWRIAGCAYFSFSAMPRCSFRCGSVLKAHCFRSSLSPICEYLVNRSTASRCASTCILS